MRWLFLAAIAVTGALINIALITDDPSSKLATIAAFNVALAGLALIWFGAYFEQHAINAGRRDIGMALLCVSAGVFVMQGGIDAGLADTCDDFFSSRPYKLRNDVLRAVHLLGYCDELGYSVAFAGACLVYVGVRLIFRMARRG